MSTFRRTKKRTAATVSVALVGAYLLVAYFLVPAIWTVHDDHRVKPLSQMVTTTEQGIPGDPVNVGLVGTKEEVIRAFAAAKWDPADAITLRSSIDIGLSVVLDRPDLDAPVSPLIFEGRKQDLAFEKPSGESADRRHHVRFWKTPETEDGRPLWLGSSSYDRGVGVSHDTGQITHHIGPDLDAERDFLIHSLMQAGQLQSTYEIEGIGATQHGRNGGGDPYFTDGMAVIGVLQPPTQ
ncbi:LssY C-terminal domain-containing protein [Rhizobiaceae bacterium n13]|uniref:LssY C-terminal domain-containing protein n=1 Tax=Ferirhizobium litorale TaxID=2927786 RepID=A0AAE3QK33_9HYPH|nr:LssY C-terminal domain-containing protein [Fererhizobium litorale]MDI7864463.1 LssY C-terminal domain-containing protein [Fererhizobium litorale]MDI7924786.1 LssY C-terminal domain-containing protein [Fererhizobium litorale]